MFCSYPRAHRVTDPKMSPVSQVRPWRAARRFHTAPGLPGSEVGLKIIPNTQAGKIMKLYEVMGM